MISGLSLRASLVRVFVGIVALSPLACGGKDQPIPIPTCQIKRADADDIVQLLAATMAADNGGWYFTIKALAESLATPTVKMQGPSPIPVPAQLYSLTRAGVTYDFVVYHYDSSQVRQAVRDSATDHFEMTVNAQFASLNINGVQGTYGFHTDPDSASATYTVYTAHALSDTVEFSAIVEDSSFSVVSSQFNVGSQRLWFFGGTLLNIVDFELSMRRSQLPANPYPFEGEVNWVIDASGMGSYDRNNVGFNILAEATMTFDGTPEATLIVTDSIQDGAYCYKYKVNLNTGVIARAD